MGAVAITYDAPPTLSRFLDSNAFVRCCIGPVGSGKSSACVLEILRRAAEQKAGPDGVRRTRFAVIRNTYRELKDTTRKTFEQWIPGQLGSWSEQDFTFTIRFGDIVSEVLFRSLNRPEDAKKLLSLELTGAYVNEMREIPKAVFDALQARVGRYPSAKDGGPTWFGIWGDTNPWHTRHWGYGLFRSQHEDFKLFRQPGGRAPGAENVGNLPAGYYDRLVAGKDSEWVKVYVDGEDAASIVGSIWGEALGLLEQRGGVATFDHGPGDVFTSWDLGRSDSTAIWFWRVAGKERVEVVDHYEAHLKPLSHYLDIVEGKGYAYRKHWLPHDARARTLASEMSVEDQARARWPGKVEIGPSLSLLDGIQAARWLLEGDRVRFHSRCEAGIDALKAYRRAWDEEDRAYSQTPVHDWSSHTADAFRYLACVAKVTEMITRKPVVVDKPAAVPMSNSVTLDELFEAHEQGRPRGRI